MKDFIQRNMPVVIIGGLTVLVFLGIILMSQTKPQTTSPTLVPLDEKEWIATYTPVLGNADAKVTLVEFSDFECPACKAIHPIIRDLYYLNQGKLKVVYRNFPLPQHSNAKLAAQAAMVAHKDGKFWQYADKLFDNQDNLDKNSLISYAEDIGLNKTEFEKSLTSNETAKYIQEDVELGTRIKISGTPTLYLNGQKMELTSFEDFRSQVMKAITEAYPSEVSTQSTSSQN